MSEDFAASRENNRDYKLLDNVTTDEDRCDSAELPEKLNNIAKSCKEVAEKLKKRNDTKYEKGQGSSFKQRTTTQNSYTRLSEFQKMADLLMSENDRLSKEIDREPEDTITINRKVEEKEDNTQIINSLKADNVKLRKVCKEITEINKRWQKYNKEVNSYIQRLEEALRDKNTERESSALSESKRVVNSELSEERPLLTRYDNLLKDTCQLQKELETQKQTEEFLREQLELLGEESQETIKLLKCQLSIYTEDYEAEKREKMLARTTSLELSRELEHVRSQLRECQKRLRQVEKASRSPGTKSPVKSTNPFVFNLVGKEGNGSKRNRYLKADGSSEIPETPRSTVSVADKKDEEAPTKHDSYECPDCGMTFPNEKHKEYLEHFEECQRD